MLSYWPSSQLTKDLRISPEPFMKKPCFAMLLKPAPLARSYFRAMCAQLLLRFTSVVRLLAAHLCGHPVLSSSPKTNGPVLFGATSLGIAMLFPSSSIPSVSSTSAVPLLRSERLSSESERGEAGKCVCSKRCSSTPSATPSSSGSWESEGGILDEKKRVSHLFVT